jgi:hypothetical protein
MTFSLFPPKLLPKKVTENIFRHSNATTKDMTGNYRYNIFEIFFTDLWNKNQNLQTYRDKLL